MAEKDGFLDNTVTIPRVRVRCTKGHEWENPGWSGNSIGIGGATFCWLCLQEKIPGFLDSLGIGRVEDGKRNG